MNKKEWADKINTHGIDVPLETNDWGSCQYNGALRFFETFFKIREDLPLEDTLEVLGCNFEYKNIVDFENVKRQMIRESMDQIYDSLEADFYSVQFEAEKIAKLAQAKTVEDLFDALRDAAFDLWTAAPYINNMLFQDLKYSAPNAPGSGPDMNVDVQMGNFITGLHCAMLYELNLITDPTSSFKNFDT
jgi:hypothetical protein